MNRCKHYNANQWFKGGNPCGIGHNLPKIVDAKCDTRSPLYLRKLFCVNGMTDILDCPSADRMTDDEQAAQEAKAKKDMRDAMDAIVTVILPNKADMIEKGEWTRTIKCPKCAADMIIGIASLNGHIRAGCTGCSFGVIE